MKPASPFEVPEPSRRADSAAAADERTPARFSRPSALGLGILGVGAALAMPLLGLPPLLAGCTPRPTRASGQELANPPRLAASQGTLATTLTARTADVDLGVGLTVRTYTYDGALPGATWELHPGDLLAVQLDNRLPPLTTGSTHSGHVPAGSASDTGAGNQPADMTRPHAWTSTNLHTHGLHVAPGGDSDDVFRVIEPGQSDKIRIQIPDDHTGGLFWYHPHLHGGVKQQVRGGMAGALIIRGEIDRVPEIRDADEKILVLQDIELSKEFDLSQPRPEDPKGDFWPDSQEFWVINGQYRPVITMRPGEVQRWRIVNAAASWMAQLTLAGHPLHHIAYDGLTINAPTPVQDTLVVPGGRVEALVKAGGVGDYDLVLLPASETPVAAPTPDSRGYVPANAVARTIATVRVVGDNVDMPLPKTLPAYDPPILPIAARRELTYSSDMSATGDLVAFGIDGHPFDPAAAPYTMTVGTAEEWLVNDEDDPFTHIFHIHVNPFLVTAVGGVPLDPPQWRDTYPIGPGSLAFTTNVADFTGKFVQHCHYVDHEDMGMMETIEVVAR